MDKKIPEKQLSRLIAQGSTIQIRGFKKDGKKVNGNLKFNDNFELFLKEKEARKVGSQKLKSSYSQKQQRQNALSKVRNWKCRKRKNLPTVAALGKMDALGVFHLMRFENERKENDDENIGGKYPTW